jgi:hypothetical protein
MDYLILFSGKTGVEMKKDNVHDMICLKFYLL